MCKNIVLCFFFLGVEEEGGVNPFTVSVPCIFYTWSKTMLSRFWDSWRFEQEQTFQSFRLLANMIKHLKEHSTFF